MKHLPLLPSQRPLAITPQGDPELMKAVRVAWGSTILVRQYLRGGLVEFVDGSQWLHYPGVFYLRRGPRFSDGTYLPRAKCAVNRLYCTQLYRDSI